PTIARTSSGRCLPPPFIQENAVGIDYFIGGGAGHTCKKDLVVKLKALLLPSATPVSSEGGTSISARAARGVRGFQHDAESPQVADAVIEAQRGSGPHRCLRHSTCLPLIFPA